MKKEWQEAFEEQMNKMKENLQPCQEILMSGLTINDVLGIIDRNEEKRQN
jgi:hypothetical protein